MNAKGIVISEDAHTVLALPPIDLNDGVVNSDVWDMGKYAHCSILILLGVVGAAATFIVQECDNFTPTLTTDIAFATYSELSSGGDTLGARATTAATGIVTGTTNSVIYQAEIDASQLTDGRPKLRVTCTDPGSASLACIVVILSGARYASYDSPTAIA